MKTPGEIKKGLLICGGGFGDCAECPYHQTPAACMKLSQDALAYIQQLEHRIGELTEKVAQPEEAHVVRCRDCEFWAGTQDSLQGKCLLTGEYPTGAWYCANGKIKEAESDA